MPIPLLMAAKAGALIRSARPLLAEWNRLDPEAKKRVQGEAADVRRTLAEVARALGCRLRGSNNKELSWADGRALALQPSAEFLLARRVVEAVLAARELDEAELAARFGEEAAGLKAALRIAERDGFIARSQPGRWQITDFADQLLVESDDILFIEQAINDHVRRVGLAGRDELALAVGSPDASASEFLAAVERALVGGTIEWLGPEMYGLPCDQLAAMAPPAEVSSAAPGGAQVKALLADLKREIDELARAIAEARADQAAALAGAPALGAVTPRALPAARDPAQNLRALKSLLDDGVITAAEFERKKADFLAQM